MHRAAPLHLHMPGSLLLAAALLSVAPRSDAGTRWQCELTPDGLRLSCRADPPATTTEPVSAEPTATVHGTRFPLDAARRWTVDLFAAPDDLERLELLARATVCYRSPGCSVALTTPARLTTRR
jgi:hypothetical protein